MQGATRLPAGTRPSRTRLTQWQKGMSSSAARTQASTEGIRDDEGWARAHLSQLLAHRGLKPVFKEAALALYRQDNKLCCKVLNLLADGAGDCLPAVSMQQVQRHIGP